MDMYVFTKGEQIKWVNNVRGTSSTFSAQNVTESKASSMRVFDYDNDFIDDVVFIDDTGKKILIARKLSSVYSIYQQDPEWVEDTLLDISDNRNIWDCKMTSMVFMEASQGKYDIIVSLQLSAQ